MSDVLFYGCQNRNQALVVSPGRSSTIFYHLHITRYQAQEQVEGVQRLALLPCSGSESAGGAVGRVRFRRMGQCPHGQSVLPLKETQQETAVLRLPARSEREKRVVPWNGKLYGWNRKRASSGKCALASCVGASSQRGASDFRCGRAATSKEGLTLPGLTAAGQGGRVIPFPSPDGEKAVVRIRRKTA